jgi:hypothetical protein
MPSDLARPRFIYTTEMIWTLVAVADRDLPTGVVLSALVACRSELPRDVQAEWLLVDGTYPRATSDLIRRGLITFTEASEYRCLIRPALDQSPWLRDFARAALAAGEALEAQRAAWRAP